jgi:hypothetical protein
MLLTNRIGTKVRIKNWLGMGFELYFIRDGNRNRDFVSRGRHTRVCAV